MTQETTIPFRTDERDQLYKLIQKYKTSPFSGKCHLDHVSFYKEKKTNLYHIILTEDQVKEFDIWEDFTVRENNHHLMFMIKPTNQDKDYIIFKKVDA